MRAEIERLQFPPSVAAPRVSRLNFEQFPVLQMSVLGDLPPPDLQELVESDVFASPARR